MLINSLSFTVSKTTLNGALFFVSNGIASSGIILMITYGSESSPS